MKKFKMMLPMLAFVFAMVGAVAGDFLAPITAYYRIDPTTCSGPQVTEQNDCKVSTDTQYTLCTILVSGTHRQAFKNPDCSVALRNVPQE